MSQASNEITYSEFKFLLRKLEFHKIREEEFLKKLSGRNLSRDMLLYTISHDIIHREEMLSLLKQLCITPEPPQTTEDPLIDSRKFCFIACVNQEDSWKECASYIDDLLVPQGYQVEKICIEGAKSLTSGYNKGMLQSNAKYKIYLHQDTFVLNRFFLINTLHLFQKDASLGMIGMAGCKTLPDNAIWWESNALFGKVYDSHTGTLSELAFREVPNEIEEVAYIDGLLMMTQFDLQWPEELFDGFHFYDTAQCSIFHQNGYHIGIPHMLSPWVLHDCGICNTSDYEKYRAIYLNAFPPDQR